MTRLGRGTAAAATDRHTAGTLWSAASIVGLLFLAPWPAVAQSVSGSIAEPSLSDLARTLQERPTDEDVRRIIERAMAAVALAEAQATRTVAEAQIKLSEREAELERMRIESRALAESAARLRSEAEAARAERNGTAADRDELSERLSRIEADLARLNGELELSGEAWSQARVAVADLRSAYSAAMDRHSASEETAARVSAVRRMAESERDELKQRLEEAITRTGQLEREIASAGEREAVIQEALDRAGKISNESWIAQLALLEEMRAATLALRDRLAAEQNRSSVLEQSLRTVTERAATLESERDRLRASVTESGASLSGELAAAREQLEQMRDRIAAHQNRSAVLEQSLRKETERTASLEGDLARTRTALSETAAQSALTRTALERERDAAGDQARNLAERLSATMAELSAVSRASESVRAQLDATRRQYAESIVMGASEAARRRDDYEAMKKRTADLEAQTALLEESYRSAVTGLNAANLEVTRLRSFFLERTQDSYVQATMASERLERELAAVRAERDSLAVELIVNRREMGETIRVVEESAEALRQARRERDAALASQASPASPRVASDTRLEAALSRLSEYEREVAALRAMLAESARPVEPRLPIGTSPPAGTVAPQPVETAPVVLVTPRPVEPVAAAVVQVDLNMSSYADLASVAEIGPTRARAIVWFRENVKPILSDDDLKSVPGFNDERIRALRAVLNSKERSR